jgi:hypothetical protein
VIRPYALNFIRAMMPFFNLVIYSQLPVDHSLKISKHISEVLNNPVKLLIEKFLFNNNAFNKKFLRVKGIPLYTVIYFKCCLHAD